MRGTRGITGTFYRCSCNNSRDVIVITSDSWLIKPRFESSLGHRFLTGFHVIPHSFQINVGIVTEEKNQLDVIYYFIVLLIGSTCFGHYYAHHQEIATIMLITTLIVSFLVCVGAARLE